jgi:hypothetical protein
LEKVQLFKVQFEQDPARRTAQEPRIAEGQEEHFGGCKNDEKSRNRHKIAGSRLQAVEAG